MTRKQKLHLAAAATAAINVGALAQFARATDIYTETWAAGIGAGYTTTSTTANGNASVVGGVLTLSTGSPAAAGHVRTYQDVTTSGLYNAAYNTQLDNNGNANILTWDLNLQYARSNPSGFGAGNYGAAYVLAASDANFMGAGEGYAITVGSTGTDPVCLVRYTAGMQAIGLGAKSAPFNMLTGGYDANLRYNSVRVTYEPGNDTWKMYLRDDGASAFTDAITTPVPAGNLVGSTVLAASATALPFTGFLQNHATAANQLARFDNIKLTLDTAPVPVPRNLLWDADATGAATDGSGTWATANTWIDEADGVTHATWNSANPDNATFGTSTGTGPAASIDAGTGHIVGLLKFNSNSPTYTINNGTLTIGGYDTDPGPGTNVDGLVAHQSATINSAINWVNNADMHVNGAGTTLTVNGALSGGGQIDKYGSGTLLLNTPAPSRSGQIVVETGTLRLTTTSGGLGGNGNGNMVIKSGATLHLDASAGALSFTGSENVLALYDQGTLRATGDVSYQRNYPRFRFDPDNPLVPLSSTIQVDSGGVLVLGRQVRNTSATQAVGATENLHTINVTGPGTLKLINGGSNAGGDSSIFSGSWNVTGGKLVLGQNSESGGSSGDTLNNLGFKNGQSGLGNRVTVSGTGVLIGTENASNPSGPVNSYKADVVLSGGTLASGNGKDSRWGGPLTTTASTTSTIAVYDPLNPAVARNLSLVGGTDQGATLIQAGPTTWNGNLVVDPGTTSGGAFNISREGGVVSVTPGATITVNANAVMNLGINQGDINGLDSGVLDALSDGTNHVNITNNGTFNIYTNTKNVGTIEGAGNTNVTTSTSMNATAVRQGTLTVGGPLVTIRPQADPYSVAANAGTSKVTSLALGNKKIDLTNTKLITQDASMVSTPVYDGMTDTYIYDGMHGLVQKGRGDGSWNGAEGITTSQTEATTGTLTSLAVGTGAELRGLGPTDTELFGGQTINGDSTVVMYTYGGDADMDGDLDGDDYFYLDSNVLQSETVFGWHQGDFNYDGRLNGDDYFILDSNILQAQASGNVFYVRDPEFAAGAGGLAAVPEPASIGLMGMAAAGLLGRRRRAR